MKLTRAQALGLLTAAAVVAAVALALAPRIPQPLEYMRFADERTLIGVPNAQNVLSNLGFLLVGLWGMAAVAARRGTFAESVERLPYLIFFLGVTLTCFGSAYFHSAPSHATLVWDRLPMTIAFTALFAALLGERTSVRLGLVCLPVFMLAGLGSVLYWIASENAGRGDLRPYIFVQYFPLLGIPLLFALFRPRYTRGADIFLVIAFYIVAKLCEGFDRAIYAASANLVGGHALKHIFAAVGVWFVLRMLEKREPA
jgi:hypothetical protein